jgi:hypothetical protein
MTKEMQIKDAEKGTLRKALFETRDSHQLEEPLPFSRDGECENKEIITIPLSELSLTKESIESKESENKSLREAYSDLRTGLVFEGKINLQLKRKTRSSVDQPTSGRLNSQTKSIQACYSYHSSSITEEFSAIFSCRRFKAPSSGRIYSNKYLILDF